MRTHTKKDMSTTEERQKEDTMSEETNRNMSPLAAMSYFLGPLPTSESLEIGQFCQGQVQSTHTMLLQLISMLLHATLAFPHVPCSLHHRLTAVSFSK